MPVVLVTERLEVPVGQVWGLIADVERYPQFMDSVRVVEKLDERKLPRGRAELVVAWEVLLEGSVLRWVEREWLHPDEHRVTFEQISGDLERFQGYWELQADGPKRTLAALEVDFEIGIPMLREVLDPFAVKAIRENSSKMLRSLDPSFQARAHEEGGIVT